MQIRLGIVDDHDLVRDGLAMILAAQPDMEVVGATGDADGAFALAAKKPHIMLVDLTLGESDGLVSGPRPGGAVSTDPHRRGHDAPSSRDRPPGVPSGCCRVRGERCRQRRTAQRGARRGAQPALRASGRRVGTGRRLAAPAATGRGTLAARSGSAAARHLGPDGNRDGPRAGNQCPHRPSTSRQRGQQGWGPWPGWHSPATQSSTTSCRKRPDRPLHAR